MRKYKNLLVWQTGFDLAIMVYSLCQQLPNDEKYGLISQMKRASVSIPSNIAEGCAKQSEKDFLRFLEIAHGSLCELLTQIEIVKVLKLSEVKPCDACTEKCNITQAMLINLIVKIKESLQPTA